MPQDRPAPGTPQDWLARAKSDLALARLPLPPGAFYEDLCFHAQQAAEKALKAVYRYHGWTFRYTHDLEELVTDLKRRGLAVPAEVDEAVILTSFAWEARYPGLGEPVSDEEYQDAIRHAHAVVIWAERHLGVGTERPPAD
jgi:HEPN domain-containing protein